MEEDSPPRVRPCPFCAEEIRQDAVLCRHCRSRLLLTEPRRWYRDHPARRVAGVASGLARALAVPVTAVRVGFIVLTFFHLAGVIAYLALWLIMPFAPHQAPPYALVAAEARHMWRRLFGHDGRPTPPGATDGGPVP
jgi:phage shock protein PspC (stress-responsive transcriptional regulator)